MMEKVRRNTSKKTNQENEYEQQRLLRIQANKCRMQSLGIKRIVASMTSLVDSQKNKKKPRKGKSVNKEDQEYIPSSGDEEENMNIEEDEYEKEDHFAIPVKGKHCTTKGMSRKGKFIPPMFVAKFLNMNKKQAMVGDEKFKSLSKAMKVVEQVISNQDQLNVNHEIIGLDEDIQGIERNADELNGNTEVETSEDGHFVDDEDNNLFDDEAIHQDYENEADMVIYNDKSRQVRKERRTREPVLFPQEGCEELVGDKRRAEMEGVVKRKRGPVYCKSLTLLPPGEKIYVQFDRDGVPIGENASIYTSFLGVQVRNRAVIPVQVKDWTDIKPEKIEHLWSCIQEKCSFDDPELRKDSVIQHARRLFRDSRHKLKKKYFNDPNLKTKTDRLKNKPEKMIKADWEFLVEHWSDEKVQAKSVKASESRSHQKMPHYNGTKSYGRFKDEFKKKHGKDCSRVDLLIESRKRKSNKYVNLDTLANNMNVVSEMKKLTEERDQGHNNHTDEQIIEKVLGKDTHGYLRAYGRGRSITNHFDVKPSKINLAHEVIEVRKTSEQAVQEARKEAEDARKEAEKARMDAEVAKKEVEATRNEVDQKIAANNKLWEKRLRNILQGYGLDDSKSNDSNSSTGSTS